MSAASVVGSTRSRWAPVSSTAISRSGSPAARIRVENGSPGRGSRARPGLEQRLGEDARRVIEQLGTGEQFVADVVVADEVPPVHGELLAQVQLDVVDRHAPPDPRAPARRHPAPAPHEAPRSSAARRRPAAGATHRRRSPRSRPRVRRTIRTRDRPTVEMRFSLAGDRLHAGHQMGDELVRRPPGARRHGVRGHLGERIEEDISLTPGCEHADFQFCVRKNDAYGRTS